MPGTILFSMPMVIVRPEATAVLVPRTKASAILEEATTAAAAKHNHRCDMRPTLTPPCYFCLLLYPVIFVKSKSSARSSASPLFAATALAIQEVSKNKRVSCMLLTSNISTKPGRGLLQNIPCFVSTNVSHS